MFLEILKTEVNFYKPDAQFTNTQKSKSLHRGAWKSQNRDLTCQAALGLALSTKNVILMSSLCLKRVLVLIALWETPQLHIVLSVISFSLSSSSDSLTQGNFFQQVEIALKEVIANGFVKDKGHAMSTEFIVGLLPAGSKGKMGSQVGHGEGGYYSSRKKRKLA